MRGPCWLGIGAQRSGTTWFTNLITQHPRVGILEKKEQHELYRGLFGKWSDGDRSAYLERFIDADRQLGEFTPYYLRALWVPPVVAELVDPSAPIIIILRNPIERFASALRHELSLAPGDGLTDKVWMRRVASDAQWGGMYATQLEAWAHWLGRSRLVVLQYEKLVSDPQGHCDDLWQRLGVDPVPLTNVSIPSWTTSDRNAFAVDDVPGLRDALTVAYRPEIDRLIDYGIDPELWDLEGSS